MELMESTKKRTVLIVDDEIKITEVLEAYLKNAGYQTKSVHSGQKAIEAAEELKPDLIILDLKKIKIILFITKQTKNKLQVRTLKLKK